MIPMSRSFSLTFPGSPFEWQPFKGGERKIDEEKTFFAPPNSWNSSLTPIFHAYGIIFGLVFALHPTLGVYIRHHKIHPCYSWCEQIFFSSRHNLSADFVCVFFFTKSKTHRRKGRNLLFSYKILFERRKKLEQKMNENGNEHVHINNKFHTFNILCQRSHDSHVCVFVSLLSHSMSASAAVAVRVSMFFTYCIFVRVPERINLK